MQPPIPIANLYYLLVYAWDHRLDEAEVVDLEANGCPDLNNLFARILLNGTEELVRRGLDRSYIGQDETASRIRGRIDFPASARRLTWLRGRLHFAFDELSHDVLHNRLVKTTLLVLRRDRALKGKLRDRIDASLAWFDQVTPLPQVNPVMFRRVQLHRNNRIYRFLLAICELIHRSMLPQQFDPGHNRFRDFTRDERLMAGIFEKFVRNFARRHLAGARVSAATIPWNATTEDPETSSLIPLMKTDVTVEWPGRKLILDCKYYPEALGSHYDALAFHSANLYQMHAYLTNKASDPGWESVEGMLLYPTNGYQLHHTLTLHGRHRLGVRTIDLNQCWAGIREELRDLLLFEVDHGAAG